MPGNWHVRFTLKGGDGGNTAPLPGDTVFLKRLYVALFHSPGEPRILFTACTESPDSGWVTQQARNLTWELTELGLRPRFLIRDRDTRGVRRALQPGSAYRSLDLRPPTGDPPSVSVAVKSW